MNIAQIKNRLRFLEEVNGYKSISRIMRISQWDRRESDAEHSWHLAVFVMLLISEYPDLDEKRCLKFALIHDLAELYTGDSLPWEDMSTKAQKEAESIERLLRIFGTDAQAAEWQGLFAEYESHASPEARFVYELDKIIPYITCYLSHGAHLHERKLRYEDVVPANRSKISKEFWLDELFEYYIDLCSESGCFYTDTN